MTSLEETLSRPGGFAARLTQLREQTGMSGQAFADSLGWGPWKIYKIEGGLLLPSAADLDRWFAACDASDDDRRDITALHGEGLTFRRQIAQQRRRERAGRRKGQPAQSSLLESATIIRFFETARIPEPARTADYARAVCDEQIRLGRLNESTVEATVTAVMARQQLLYAGGRVWEFLLAEPALYWSPGSPAVMRGQLDRLHGMIGVPGIRFGILPMGRRPPMVPVTAFHLFDDLAVVELFTGETYAPGSHAALYRQVMDGMWSGAVEGEDARRLIVTARDSLPGDVEDSEG